MKFHCHICNFNTRRNFRLIDHLNKNHLVTCKLMGGLGNQLFQIFTTIAYSIENKVNYILPNKYELIMANCTIRHTYWDSLLKNLQIGNDTSYFKLYKELQFNYKKIPLLKKKKRITFFDTLKLQGYFQSYKYFDNYKNNIFNLIKLDEFKNEIKLKCDQFDFNNKYISLHFRIGDFVLYPNSHSLLKLSYYKNCINYIIEKTNYDKFQILYFCEQKDNELVLKKIRELKNDFKNLTFIKVDDTFEDWEQMLIMSLCKHNIIANSTFSWWGAYFNTDDDHIVCYPSKWFGSKMKDYILTDLFPSHFTLINSE